MAAGSELIDLLGTGDRLDERTGERAFKIRSTVELPGVDFPFRVARHAGFVKVRKGTVSATRRGAQLGRDPLADWLAERELGGRVELAPLGVAAVQELVVQELAERR